MSETKCSRQEEEVEKECVIDASMYMKKVKKSHLVYPEDRVSSDQNNER